MQSKQRECFVWLGLDGSSWLWCLCSVFLLARAFAKKRRRRQKQSLADPQLAAEHLAGALRCKTYGLVTEDSENIKEFEKLQAHLRACFPHVFQTVTTEEVKPV